MDKRLCLQQCLLSEHEKFSTSTQHYCDFNSPSHESYGRIARGKHLHEANAPSSSNFSDTSDQKTTFKTVDCFSDKTCSKGRGHIPNFRHCSDENTIFEPVDYISEKPRPKGLGAIPIPQDELQHHIEERRSRELSFEGFDQSGIVQHLYPPVENLIAAGFRRIGNNLVCDGCRRSHPIARYNTMDLSPSSLHYPLCRYIDRVLCRHCCQGMDSIGQDDEEGCIRCGRAIRLRAFGENTMQFPNANLQREQDLRAFSEEMCCVQGCNRTVQRGLERCLRCSRRVCDDCTGRCCGSNRTFN